MPSIFDGQSKKVNFPGLTEIVKSGRFNSHWGSLVVCPKNLRFESQQDDEEVIVFGRKHFVTNIGWMAVICFGVFVPLFWGEFPVVSSLSVNVHLSMTILWYMALLFYGVQSFLLWFYNVYIVTNERIVDVDFFGLLYKNINVTPILNVQDVNYSQKGILSSFLNYGDVIIQTASEQRSSDVGSERAAFTFQAISSPDTVVRIISELMELEEEDQHHLTN